MKNWDLILASASPRRAELLREIGYPFRVVVSNAKELEAGECHWNELALLNAAKKAEEVANRFPEALVIGADTVIEFEKGTIGKPNDREDAIRILRRLSGHVHTVTTGVCIRRIADATRIRFTEQTLVRFKPFGDSVIEDYLEKVDVLDKAGAYALQEYGSLLIESVEGSRSNVIGLPLERLTETFHARFA